MIVMMWRSLFFFFNDTATTEIYTLSLHDALPISPATPRRSRPRARACRAHLHRGAAAWGSRFSLPYGLPFLDRDGFFVERPAVVREDPALQLAGAPLRHRHDGVRQPRPGVLPVERRRRGRVIRMGVVHADHLKAVAVEPLLRAQIGRASCRERV